MCYVQIVANTSDDTAEHKLSYVCQNCGKTDEVTGGEDVCVSTLQLKKTSQSFGHMINRYTKYDPTLPRIDTVPCPNSECPTNQTETPREIIIMRYDDMNMRYVYLCSTCDTVWKLGGDKTD